MGFIFSFDDLRMGFNFYLAISNLGIGFNFPLCGEAEVELQLPLQRQVVPRLGR
jgi:hypothetical protein